MADFKTVKNLIDPHKEPDKQFFSDLLDGEKQQAYEDGHIASGKYVSSFMGFFPADKPQYLALIIVDEPQGTYYGSAVAAPVAKDIFEDIIKIKNIQPYG